MVCLNNPCPEFLPKVGDPSPIVGDEGNTSNMNLIATGYSGGRKRRASRKAKKAGSRHYKRRSARKNGGRRSSRKYARKSLRKRRS